MTTHSNFTIGRDVRLFGRWFRLLVGVYFALLATVVPLIEEPVPATEALAFLGTLGLYFALILAVYIVAFYLLGERVLARTNPWVGTIILLGPLAVITALRLGPQPFRVALGLYYSIASIFNFAMSYGGCEVVAIPSLMFRRRYTLYCPYNAVDVVENALLTRSTGERLFAFVSMLIAVVVGGYFLLVETFNMVRDLGVSIDVDNRWALLLGIPFVFLLYNAWVAYRQRDRQLTTAVRRQLLGALVLLVLTVIFVSGEDWGPFWAGAMLLGGLVVLIRWIRGILG